MGDGCSWSRSVGRATREQRRSAGRVRGAWQGLVRIGCWMLSRRWHMAYSDGQGKTVERICQHCQSPFTVPSKVLKQGRGKFCSVQCSNAARAVGGSSHSWLRALARREAQKIGVLTEASVCAACKKPLGMAGHIHHCDENPYNNSYENLTVLCPKCHIAHHNTVSPKRMSQIAVA